MQDIKCNDDADAVGFTVLDSSGLDTGFYNWTIWYDPFWSGDYQSCWINADTAEKVEGYKIYPGDAIWISGSSDSGQILTCSGQVGVKDVSVVLRNGGLMTGNPNPVAIDLQDIICNDAADSVGFTVLDSSGLDTGFYNWTIWYDPFWSGDYQSCWINADTAEKVEGMMIEPGQGLWISGSVDPEDPTHPDPAVDQIITFPGVELAN